MANNGKIIAALLLGAAAGAAIGILFAPDKGSETRKKIANKASDIGDEINERYTKRKEAVNNFKDKVATKAEAVKNNVQSRVNDIRESADDSKIRTRNSSNTVV